MLDLKNITYFPDISIVFSIDVFVSTVQKLYMLDNLLIILCIDYAIITNSIFY